MPIRLVGGQMQRAERSYPWQPWKREAATNQHHHTEEFSGDTYQEEYLPDKYLWSYRPPGREGGVGAWIRNNSQEGTIDPLWSAKQGNKALQHYVQNCKFPKCRPACHSATGDDHWPTRSSLTLPKLHLATFKLTANDELGSWCLKS